MKLALISDIHGNFVALEACLADIRRERVDRIICLGDVAASGPQPHECLTRLRELNCPSVMGNADEFFINPQPFDTSDERMIRIRDLLFWGVKQITSADRDFIHTFTPRVETALSSEYNVMLFHGSPQSNEEIILATTPDAELEKLLGPKSATIKAGGHTHTQMIRHFQQTLVLNPGSVGLPFEVAPRGQHRPAWAEYAILSAADGEFGVELRRVSYDIQPLIEITQASGMPHGDWWLSGWTQNG
jgi:putative phosphoesterase